MKVMALMLLLYCPINFISKGKQEVINKYDEQIKGKWTNERVQIQYIVDSHLVHEKEITTQKGKVFYFDGEKVQVKYPDGTTAQGSFNVLLDGEDKKLVIQLAGTTTTYNLVAVTPGSMVWQKDLEDVYYYDGTTRKSAERAIYTEEFKR